MVIYLQQNPAPKHVEGLYLQQMNGAIYHDKTQSIIMSITNGNYKLLFNFCTRTATFEKLDDLT